MKRREFLHIVGLSGAAAASGGCGRGGGPSQIIPYVIPADDGILPGQDVEYATVCRECPAGCGMIAKVRDGRVHKVEGNPDHPVNRGKLCLRGQTSVQGLYNPDRFRGPMIRDSRGRLQPVTWEVAQARFLDAITRLKNGRAAWVGQLENGALDRLVESWLSAIAPAHTHLRFEPLNYEPLQAASERITGKREIPHFRLDKAHTILSFGADFVETWISNVEYTRQFSAWRQARAAGKHRGRYVFIGPRLSLTGQNADEWISIRPGTESVVAAALTAVVTAARSRTALSNASLQASAEASGVKPETLERIGREFAAGSPALALPPGNSFYSAGATDACEAVMRLNQAAGNTEKLISWNWPHALGQTSPRQELLDLVGAMDRGEIAVLFLHGVNPAYSLPPSVGFAKAVQKVPIVISFSSFADETTGYPGETGGFASLVLPDHTFLESWGEYTPRPGIRGLLQPVVTPLFDTRPTSDLLLESASKLGHDLGASTFQEYVRKEFSTDEIAWETTLQRGGVFDTVREQVSQTGMQTTSAPGVNSPVEFATAGFDAPAAAVAKGEVSSVTTAHPHSQAPTQSNSSNGLLLHVYPSLQFYDGRLANRPWAQEIPDSASKAVWGSWVEIHSETAARLGVQNGSLVEVATQFGKLQAPALVTTFVRPDTVAIEMGQGRRLSKNFGARLAGQYGVNAMTLLGPLGREKPGVLEVTMRALQAVRPLVVLQASSSDASTRNAESGGLAQSVRMTDLTKHIPPKPEPESGHPALYNEAPPKQHPRSDHHWGMLIDLDRCVGCSACVAACYAENNVPVVGAEECGRGREMSWIRIETYTKSAPGAAAPASGDPAAIELDHRFLPMLCQQCDNAPCEYVCPVNATVHNDEGLNMQVYNRCVGTRFCSNNCPYKVRRFNWFNFDFPFPLDQQLNPDVMHRKKGVMEKCSFCIQRIRSAEIDAGPKALPIPDGQIQTACMQSCPADAIIFGDRKDPGSMVNQQFDRNPRGYAALGDLNTFPNVTYLQRVRASQET